MSGTHWKHRIQSSSSKLGSLRTHSRKWESRVRNSSQVQDLKSYFLIRHLLMKASNLHAHSDLLFNLRMEDLTLMRSQRTIVGPWLPKGACVIKSRGLELTRESQQRTIANRSWGVSIPCTTRRTNSLLISWHLVPTLGISQYTWGKVTHPQPHHQWGSDQLRMSRSNSTKTTTGRIRDHLLTPRTSLQSMLPERGPKTPISTS